MASKNDQVGDFFELRHGFEALHTFASAALRFLDMHGIALGAPRTAPSSNGTSPTPPSQTLREKVKRHYTARRAATPAATKQAAGHYSSKRRAARAHSAALLASLDRDEPRPITDPADRVHMGSLTRRGYAKKKGDGYVLTAKGAKRYQEDRKAKADASASASASDGHITVKEAAKRLGMSDSNVRLLVKAGKLAATTDMRARDGFTKAVKTVVLDAAEVGRYAAEINT